jgi:hypothetical protein
MRNIVTKIRKKKTQGLKLLILKPDNGNNHERVSYAPTPSTTIPKVTKSSGKN